MSDYMKEMERLLDAFGQYKWSAGVNAAGFSHRQERGDEEEAEEARAALLAHAAQADRAVSGVPDGWKLVPVEPTPEMLGAGLRHVEGMASMPSAYRAMLAAAPAPDQLRDAAKMMADPAGDRIAADIRYPECWDTAVYPTIESALRELRQMGWRPQ